MEILFYSSASPSFADGSVSSRGDEPGPSTDPTELEQPGQEERRTPFGDKDSCDDDNPPFSHTVDSLSAAKTEPGELLYCVGGASLAEEESPRTPFAGHVGHSDGAPGSDHGHGITIRQNYAPWTEPLGEQSSGDSKINPLEDVKFYCLTQGCTGRGSTHLRLHIDGNRTISRWRLGSEIRYTVDYNSFLAKGRSRADADHALRSLQDALAVWSAFDIGIRFIFIEPNTGPVTFELRYDREPLYGPANLRSYVLAASFFPVHKVSDLELCVYDISFDPSLRPHMTKTFLHEVAHILGGRHEDAAEAEQDEPSVQLGLPNKDSVLVTDRHPSAIWLHWKDIRWFQEFMAFPEGHVVGGFPISSITP
ncbi:hypothetical protein EKO27_g10579 [Xylaria grammica]|uniref:Peptidase metallopeptidase domain-containing protein n=1 Tax=Xylaria grammica TaxID=363999 RepID=A0A439CQU9_9PEZI|nr:hypothetical protein EKO27_g10579 [Xylaria grammica]